MHCTYFFVLRYPANRWSFKKLFLFFIFSYIVLPCVVIRLLFTEMNSSTVISHCVELIGGLYNCIDNFYWIKEGLDIIFTCLNHLITTLSLAVKGIKAWLLTLIILVLWLAVYVCTVYPFFSSTFFLVSSENIFVIL